MIVAALVVSIIAIIVPSSLSSIAIWYARRAAHASEYTAVATDRGAVAAEQSAVAAHATAALESDRRHAELTPHLRIQCRPANPGSEDYTLTVRLVGPPELGQLDKLILTIRDDNPWRERGTPLAGPTKEAVRAIIWGPLRLVPGVGPGADPAVGAPGASATGRTITVSGLPVGEAWIFALEPTLPPRWAQHATADWRRERGTILRLTMECHKDGAEPWTLTGEIDVQTDNPVEVPARP